MRFLVLPFFVGTLTLCVGQNTIDPSGKKQGKWQEYYPNDALKYSGHYKDDKPTGIFMNYDKTGKLISKLDYQEQGVQAIFYHANEQKKATGSYLNKLKEGQWLYFNPTGDKISEESFERGKKNGPSITYYNDGQIAQIDTFDYDVQTGTQIKYFKSGKIKQSIGFVDGIQEGKYREYYSNGNYKTAGIHSNGLQEGKWIFYNEDGSTHVREQYSKGTRISQEKVNGEFKTYYEDKPDILKEVCKYKDGKKEGSFIEFYKVGGYQLIDKTFQANPMAEPTVEKVRVFVGEQIKSKGLYKNGLRHGTIKNYNKQGELVSEETYNKGQKIE